MKGQTARLLAAGGRLINIGFESGINLTSEWKAASAEFNRLIHEESVTLEEMEELERLVRAVENVASKASNF
jgi:hypothetical protein